METVLSDEDLKVNLAMNVRRLMQDRGWSQVELAKRSGVHQTYISRIVRGANVVGYTTLRRLANAFDVSIDRILDEPPTKNIS